MGDGRYNFERLAVAANLGCLKRKMRALFQRDGQVNATIVTATIQHIEQGLCAAFQNEVDLLNAARVLNDDAG